MEISNRKELVSIITPTYNSEKFVLDAIETVKNQTYQNWEMIIVDDNSSDNTVNIIKSEIKKDNRIRLYQQKINGGSAIARNTAIKLAKGRYIAFLDSDDLWYPQKLEYQISYMKKNNIAFTFSSYEIIKENGLETGKVISVPEKITYQSLLKNTIIGCLTVILDIEKLGIVQMPNIRTRQDTALWLSILKKGITAYGIQQPLAKYRKVGGSISSNKLKMAKQNWKLYRDIEGLNVIYSSWCFINYAFNALKKSL